MGGLVERTVGLLRRLLNASTLFMSEKCLVHLVWPSLPSSRPFQRVRKPFRRVRCISRLPPLPLQ
jgi:hypothetical protein